VTLKLKFRASLFSSPKLRHYKESLSDLKAAALIDATCSDIYYNQAMCMINEKDFPAAVRHLL
jgi:hypothetical protein